MATIAYTPKWARNVNCEAWAHTNKCSPRSTEEFGRFARAAVIRYRDKGVHTWEIWNEPNLSAYWKTARPNKTLFVDPEAYARTANAAAQQIMLRDKGAKVITGGLAPEFEPKYPRGMRQSDYLARLLPKLNHTVFAGVGIHPYSWPKMPSLAANYNAYYTVDNGSPQYDLRGIMTRYGWGDKQIWATEFGASTKGLRSVMSITGARPDHVSETLQAKIIQQGVADWDNKPNAGPIFVHSDSDEWLPTRKNEGGFGLRRSDGTKKPAYVAFQKSAQQLKP